MYKVFAFLFFSIITYLLVSMFADWDIPMGKFIIVNAVVYLGFIVYVLISSLFQFKKNLREVVVPVKIRQKLKPFNPSKKILNSFFSLSFILLSLFTALYVFFLFVAPVFTDILKERFQPPEEKENRRLEDVEASLENLRNELFLLQNKKTYTDEDDQYYYYLKLKPSSRYHNYQGYGFRFTNKESGKNRYGEAEAYIVEAGEIIEDFEVISENYPVFENNPLVVLIITTNFKKVIQPYYPRNLNDYSTYTHLVGLPCPSCEGYQSFRFFPREDTFILYSQKNGQGAGSSFVFKKISDYGDIKVTSENIAEED